MAPRQGYAYTWLTPDSGFEPIAKKRAGRHTDYETTVAGGMTANRDLTCMSSALSAIWWTLSLAAKRKPMACPDILPAARAILGMSFGPAEGEGRGRRGRGKC